MSFKFLKKLFIFLVVLLAGLLIIFYLITSQQQTQHKKVSTHDVNTAQKLVSESIKSLGRNDGNIELMIDQQQLNAIMSVASYALPKAEFSGVINPFGVLLQGNAHLPLRWPKRSINLSCLLTPFNYGFAIDHCQLGKLHLPDWFANWFLQQLVKFALASPADQQLLDLFAKGQLKNNKLEFIANNLGPIKLRFEPQLYQPLKLLSANQAKAEDIEFYLSELQILQQQYPKERRLAFFSHRLLLTATARAKQTSQDTAYRDAIWALAVAFANKSFIHYANANLTTRDVPKMPAVLLNGRRDLSLHFLYSAVLQMLGTTELSQQVGNLKEIMDAGAKGSGFSFVDLAADRAGTQFAAFINDINAEHLLSFNSDNFEAAIMPVTKDLPEGLTEQQMQQQFGGYEGTDFKQLTAEIEVRVAQLALYQWQ